MNKDKCCEITLSGDCTCNNNFKALIVGNPNKLFAMFFTMYVAMFFVSECKGFFTEYCQLAPI